MTTIGVLAFQGDFNRHIQAFTHIGAQAKEVRSVSDLSGIDALVIPGGESTTIGMLMKTFGLLEPVRRAIIKGMPVLGTCAGLILLSKEVDEKNQHRLGVLNIDVYRNAYGRQVDSFEADIRIPILGADPFRGVFIRAPIISSVSEDVEILSRFENNPVLVRTGCIIAASFHPELTEDLRLHRYFLEHIPEK